MPLPHVAGNPGFRRNAAASAARAAGAGLAVLAAFGLFPTGAHAGPSSGDPVDLRSSFGSDRLPPGWRVDAGRWKAVDGHFVAPRGGRLAGLLRTNGLAVADSDFRIELWAEFAEGDAASPARSPDAGAGPALAVSWGGVTAGLMEAGRHSAFVSFAGPGDARETPRAAGGDADASRADQAESLESAGEGAKALPGRTASPGARRAAGGAPPAPFLGGRFPGRFRLEIASGWALSPRRGGVSVRTDRGPWYSRRDVFGRSAGARPKEILVSAGPGVSIYAARVRTRPRPRRGTGRSPSAAALADGDRSYREGELAAAQASYAVAKLDGDSPPSARAEAAYKYGVVVAASGNLTAAKHACEEAIRLDPEGPWGERARLALGEAAFEAGDAELALGLARGIVASTPSGIEEWDRFRSLVSRSREELVKAGAGPKATYMLRVMAERIEWASRRRDRASWMWGEVALAYAARGWNAEAEALRARASRLLGGKVRPPVRKAGGRKRAPEEDGAEAREEGRTPDRPDETRSTN